MVIYGGNAHKHDEVEMCYDSSLYLYHLGCHVWANNISVSSNASSSGRFGHVAVSAYGNILMIVGGYTGYMLGDLIAYKFSPTVAPPKSRVNEDIDYCLLYEHHAECTEDRECIWCKEERTDIHRPGCVHRTRAEMCTSTSVNPFTGGLCFGICSQLKTCYSCLSQGRGPMLTDLSPRRRFYIEECSWCVKHSKCQKKHVPIGSCASADQTDSGLQGWWSGLSKSLTDINQCQSEDFPAGLQWIRYRPPMNISYPDEIVMVKKFPQSFEFETLIDKPVETTGYYITNLIGYIHPLDAPPFEEQVLTVFLGLTNVQIKLNLSRDSSVEKQEDVMSSAIAETRVELAARRHDGSPLFTNVARGYKYYVNLRAAQIIERSTGIATSTCEGLYPSKYLITSAIDCPVCADYVDCYSCSGNHLCEWISDDAVCIRRGRYDFAIRNISDCLTPCHMRTSCTECMSEKNECMWCMTTKTCSPVFSYVSTYLQGQCRNWIESHEAKEFSCWDCSIYKSCKSCLAHYGCGWCGNTENPNIGHCVQGDFSGPLSSVQCSRAISQVNNISDQQADWSYGICPDVEECLLGLHNCHPNATCHNTFNSYTCFFCNAGFIGNGQTECEKTCDYECVHGICSNAPDYECRCDIGWRAPDCNTSCGCNGHSTCHKAVGLCDECQHLTMGEQCHLCRPGSYGDPTDEEGCQPCDCNGHGNKSQGECDIVTGECICTDNTMGLACENCMDGYYGDPRNGENCYLKCENRLLLTNITQGSLGSHGGKGIWPPWHAYCLWILTDAADIEDQRLEEDIPTITFTMEQLNTDCTMVRTPVRYVYDGIPSSIQGSSENDAILLASFCGPNAEQAKPVIARSGILTVYFEADIDGARRSHGFNASYHVNRCVGDCAQEFSQVCTIDKCSCMPGFSGTNCTSLQCPADCLFSQNSTSCICITQSGDGKVKLEFSPWITNSLGSQLGRFGHTLTACGESLFMFGGYSLEHGLLNDLWQYNITSSHWHKVTPITNDEPAGTYHHAAACIEDLKTMFIFGGFTSISESHRVIKASNQFWQFTVESKKWTRISVPTWVQPIAGHSLTRVEDTKLIVIGGISTENYYSDKIYEYDASSGYILAWREYVRKKDVFGAVPVGLYGHSAVYHEHSNTIYIFGGQMYKSDRFYISDELYTYDVQNKRWNLLQPTGGSWMAPHMFHTAVSTEDYMVVIGNRTQYLNYASCLLVYHYKCNFWHCLDLKDMSSVWSPNRLSSLSAATLSGNIYVIGGFDNMVHSELIKLVLPSDPCSFYEDTDVCLAAVGCSACILTLPDGKNQTVCSTSGEAMQNRCLELNATLISGVECNMDWHLRRECTSFKHCSQCLAVYPQFKTASPVCQWCTNCPDSMCIPQGKACEVENECPGISQHDISDAGKCMEHTCQATDCDKCVNAGVCMWTQQIARSSELKRVLSLQATYNWTCVMESLKGSLTRLVEIIPPDECPARCYTYKSCSSCLSSRGSEGGAMKCMWSEQLQECVPPAYIPIHCSGGECGFMISGAPSSFCSGNDCDYLKRQQVEKKCPHPCWEHKTCATCIKTQGCGWCAFSGFNGVGVCISGGLKDPTGGFCSWDNVTNGVYPLNAEEKLRSSLSVAPPVWSYLTCPPENECTNNNHNCDLETQNCTDVLDGFLCFCKNRYLYNEATQQCQPECHQGCVHGRCVSPDVCECDFGWVGNNCSVQCLCNQHSNCQSVSQRKVCLECHNNTQGKYCEQCQLYFVGNPRNGGTCRSCAEFCYNHSNICLSRIAYQKSILLQSRNNSETYGILDTKVTKGPTEDDAICMECQDNTRSRRCDECQTGYFRLDKAGHKLDPCVKCQCNGHSDFCNKDTGEGCECMNNTRTQCGRKDGDHDMPCWMTQCATCKEYYIGTPTNGHQCYHQMKVNQDFCFDPDTQNECSQNPGPLHRGRTVFFVVQPKYLNVDIRVTIDVTQGGADVYFSPRNDTFVVDVDSEGFHDIQFDESINIMEMGRKRRKRRSLSARYLSVSGRREAILESENARFYIDVMPAEELNTFITVEQNKSILVVRNVRCRLVITLPLDKHDLQFSKFYIVIHGIGDNIMNETFGNLYFRQDQPHIDLFVFFSVFFSCFFLFLALCVVMWKMKQVVDTRRSRQQRAKEMLHMASRPFAKVLLLIESDVPPTPSPLLAKKNQCGGLLSKTHTPVPLSDMTNTFPMNNLTENHSITIVPIAIEPTDDGIAGVGSVIFQLPGGFSIPAMLCLGSTLTMRIHSGTSGLKSSARHRPVSIT
ncbi:hypothetical protein ScPMuIL_010907 [Solemya velum]